MISILIFACLFAASALAQSPSTAYIINSTVSTDTIYVIQVNMTFVDLDSQGIMYYFTGISGFFSNFSSSFLYNVHVNQISTGSCGDAGGHFNPDSVNYTQYPAIPGQLSTYEAGDLSGKWGAINSTLSGQVPLFTVTDPTLSLNVSSPYYIGNRSIVIHANNSTQTKLACANILPSYLVNQMLYNATQMYSWSLSLTLTTSASGGYNSASISPGSKSSSPGYMMSNSMTSGSSTTSTSVYVTPSVPPTSPPPSEGFKLQPHMIWIFAVVATSLMV